DPNLHPFPYTTLFRSQRKISNEAAPRTERGRPRRRRSSGRRAEEEPPPSWPEPPSRPRSTIPARSRRTRRGRTRVRRAYEDRPRSEEHTSELQSRFDL